MAYNSEQSWLNEKLEFWKWGNGEAVADWAEHHVKVKVLNFDTGGFEFVYLKDMPTQKHPETGRSYRDLWEWQKESYLYPALERHTNGKFRYDTLVNCTPRGEGKTAVNVIIMLHRFFCFVEQKIICGANSKQQSVFSVKTIAEDIILNSDPLLSLVPRDDIKDKEIRLRDSRGEVRNTIIAISAKHGVYSNITLAIFSEIFQMAPPFEMYYQLDSSRRNIPHSLVLVDSTVSDKHHVLYHLYDISKKPDSSVFFNYTYSNSGDYRDYYHPLQTQQQLDSFREKFTDSEFKMFFLNKWSGKSTEFFPEKAVEALNIIGIDSQVPANPREIITLCQQKIEAETNDDSNTYEQLKHRLVPLPYKLEAYGHPDFISGEALLELRDMYDTDFALGIGIDMADALKDDLTKGARTIAAFMLKGLPGSLHNPSLTSGYDPDDPEDLSKLDRLNFVYFCAGLFHVETSDANDVVRLIAQCKDSFAFPFNVLVERWGSSEIVSYCESEMIPVEVVHPSYGFQREVFNRVYRQVIAGKTKVPELPVQGRDESVDILREELRNFIYDSSKKFYGSPTKSNPRGIQDDSVYAWAYSHHSLRKAIVQDFDVCAQYGKDASIPMFGLMIKPQNVAGY